MNCKKVQKKLYDFLTHRLEQDIYQKIDEHVKACQQCQIKLKSMENTISLLDIWEPPDVSADFEEKVLRRIREQQVANKSEDKEQRSMVWALFEKIFFPYYIKLPLEGLTVAIVVLLCIVVYRGFSPQKVDEKYTISKETQIILNEVKNPILIKTDDAMATLESLKAIVQAHQGTVLQTLFMDSDIKITFQVKEKEELPLTKKLLLLGDVLIEKESYRDPMGNIVILLKAREKARVP